MKQKHGTSNTDINDSDGAIENMCEDAFSLWKREKSDIFIGPEANPFLCSSLNQTSIGKV